MLRLMRRHYDTALFRSRIEYIRRRIPDAFIGVDLIVGARGETPELFEQSRAFVDSLDISRLHVFPYSERPGTRALELAGAVEPAEKHRRTGIMLRLSEAKWADFAERFAGTRRPVLLEHPKDRPEAPMAGFTDNYLRVEVAGAGPELDNTIVGVELGAVNAAEEKLNGTLAQQTEP